MTVAVALLLAGILVVLVRLFVGPTPWDRLLAYNSASNRVFVLLAVLALGSGRSLYLDVALVYAALSFLGVVVLARYMERGGGGDDQ